jgi:hypothetical protein
MKSDLFLRQNAHRTALVLGRMTGDIIDHSTILKAQSSVGVNYETRGLGSAHGGAQLIEQRREQCRIESNRTELQSQIAYRSRPDLPVYRDMARAIGGEDAETEFIWAHALHNGFAVAPIVQSFQLSQEALPRIAGDPTGSGSSETIARYADAQSDITASRVRRDRRRQLRHTNLHLPHAIRQSHGLSVGLGSTASTDRLTNTGAVVKRASS